MKWIEILRKEDHALLQSESASVVTDAVRTILVQLMKDIVQK